MNLLKAITLLFFVGSTNTFAESKFLSLPFNDVNVTLQQGPLYTPDADKHWGESYAFDYIKGTIDASYTWQEFPVLAAADGVAIHSCEGADADTPTPFSDGKCSKGYGHFVLIRHDQLDDAGKHYYTLYGHLNPATIADDMPQLYKRHSDFSKWKRVRAGDYLGMAGQTGLGVCNSNNCIHLHFEVWKGGYFKNGTDPYNISGPTTSYTRNFYPHYTSLADCGNNGLWIECPSAGDPLNMWSVGDVVEITEEGVNVREEPYGIVVGSQSNSMQGTITSGAIYVHPYWWWEVDFNSGPDGWVAESYLQEDSSCSKPTERSTIRGSFTGRVRSIRSGGGATIPGDIATGDHVTGQYSYVPYLADVECLDTSVKKYVFDASASEMEVMIAGITWSAEGLDAYVCNDNVGIYCYPSDFYDVHSSIPTLFPGLISKGHAWFNILGTTDLFSSTDLPVSTRDLNLSPLPTGASAQGGVWTQNDAGDLYWSIVFDVDPSSFKLTD